MLCLRKIVFFTVVFLAKEWLFLSQIDFFPAVFFAKDSCSFCSKLFSLQKTNVIFAPN